jgi:hypothetical protein
MHPLKLRIGPLLNVVQNEGWNDYVIATDEQIADSIGFYIAITNTSKARLWIDNVCFLKGPSHDERSLNPIFPNRSQSYPTRLPVSLEPGITIDYAVAFSQIPKLMADATCVRIRYRNYYLPVPIYRHVDSSDQGFLAFIAALRMKS